MFERFIFAASALTLVSATSASVTMTVDILDAADGGNQAPPTILCVDVFVDVTTDDTWTAGGLRALAGNGTAFRYARDPNTSIPIVVNPGTGDRFVTFFSRPRDRDVNARFNNGAAAAAGEYDPTGPVAIFTASQANVAYFASPPETIFSPSVDGYVFRLALDLPAGVTSDMLSLFQGMPAPGVAYVSSRGAFPENRGTVNATFDVPALTGFDWYVALIPEPATLAMLTLCGLAALGRR